MNLSDEVKERMRLAMRRSIREQLAESLYRPTIITTDNTTQPQFKDPKFIRACELAGLEPSRRQAAKFRRGEGKAFKTTLGGQMERVNEIPEKRAPRVWDDEV